MASRGGGSNYSVYPINPGKRSVEAVQRWNEMVRIGRRVLSIQAITGEPDSKAAINGDMRVISTFDLRIC